MDKESIIIAIVMSSPIILSMILALFIKWVLKKDENEPIDTIYIDL